MLNTIYHQGGFMPDVQSKNRAEEYDSDTATYTRWDESGKVLEQRPLTPEEIATLTPPVTEQKVDISAAISEAQTAISAATSVSTLRAATLKLVTAIASISEPTTKE